MSGLREDGRSSAQDVTYRYLKQHISELPREGGTFLTELEVATAAGTSRTPVREALLRLEAEGFLEIVPKKGAYVPPISGEEVRAVMQARELVESWCVRKVVRTGSDIVAELDELLARQRTLLADPIGFIDCDRAFHRLIVGAAGNPVLVGFYESLRDRQVRMGLRAVARTSSRAQTVLTEHAAIVEGIRSGDQDKAEAEVKTHLSSTLRALRVVER
jgi:DNA-binding GntR family transcriptional regulator